MEYVSWPALLTTNRELGKMEVADDSPNKSARSSSHPDGCSSSMAHPEKSTRRRTWRSLMNEQNLNHLGAAAGGGSRRLCAPRGIGNLSAAADDSCPVGSTIRNKCRCRWANDGIHDRFCPSRRQHNRRCRAADNDGNMFDRFSAAKFFVHAHLVQLYGRRRLSQRNLFGKVFIISGINFAPCCPQRWK